MPEMARLTAIVMKETKRGQIRPGRKCATVNCKQADPSLAQRGFSETNYLQEHRDRRLEVGRHACACHRQVKCQCVNEQGQARSRDVSEQEARGMRG